MHFHLTGNHDDDTCDIPHCISHQKFALTLLERVWVIWLLNTWSVNVLIHRQSVGVVPHLSHCPWCSSYITTLWLLYCKSVIAHYIIIMGRAACYREEFNKAKGLNQSVEKDPKLFSTMLHNAYCIDNNRECPNYVSWTFDVHYLELLHVYSWTVIKQ